MLPKNVARVAGECSPLKKCRQVPAHLVSGSPLRCHGQDIILEPNVS